MPVVNVYSKKQFHFSKSTISKILFLRSKKEVNNSRRKKIIISKENGI
jgi:hypothetical protein